MELSKFMDSIGASSQKGMDLQKGVSRDGKAQDSETSSFDKGLTRLLNHHQAAKEKIPMFKLHDHLAHSHVTKKSDQAEKHSDSAKNDHHTNRELKKKNSDSDHHSKEVQNADASKHEQKASSSEEDSSKKDSSKDKTDPAELKLSVQQVQKMLAELKQIQMQASTADSTQNASAVAQANPQQQAITVANAAQQKENVAVSQNVAQKMEVSQSLAALKLQQVPSSQVDPKASVKKASSDLEKLIQIDPKLAKKIQMDLSQSAAKSQSAEKLQLPHGAKELSGQSSIPKVETPALMAKNMFVHKAADAGAKVEMKLNHDSNKITKDLSPQPSLKQLADSLFIQKGLSVQMDGNSLIKSGTKIFQIQPNPSAHLQAVKANLINDMQAFVSKAMLTKEGGSMNLRLRPGNLGEVQIDVKVNANNVRVHMNADNQSAYGLLKGQVHELHDQLHSAGLKVDSIFVSNDKTLAEQSQHHDSQADTPKQNNANQQNRQQQNNQPKREFLADYDDQGADRSVA